MDREGLLLHLEGELLMTSQDVILGILMETSCSGYDIKHKFETLFSHFYNASYGTIYPTLSRMEKSGLITKESVVQAGKPTKNIYTITEQGRRAFYHYLESELGEVEIKSDFMIRMYFGALAQPELVSKWLTEGIRNTERALAVLYEERERSQAILSPTQRICLNIGITNQENLLQQLEAGLSELGS